jgi:menaquinone-dependent protoporphyrinogen IX oxidase
MKVWIVHDSKFGNGKSLAEAMGEVFQQKIDVGIGHIKKVTPREVANDKPDLIIVGTPVRAFSTSFASKMWIRGLKKQLREVNHVIPLGVVYLTHAMPKKMVEFWGKRFHKTLDRGIAIAEVYPGWLSGRVKDTQGPLEEGTTENFVHIAQQILENIVK